MTDLIYVDSFNILIGIIIFLSSFYIFFYFINRHRGFQEYDEYEDFGNTEDKISFVITNRTDNEITVDVCNLDELDNSYTFYTSPNNYQKLIEYLKSHIVYVHYTVIEYSNDDYVKKFVYKTKHDINKTDREPIISSLDNIDIYQYRGNIIVSEQSYNFNYFNSLELKLSPNEKIAINLYYDQYDKKIYKKPIKHIISLKNNSEKTEVVKLFDKAYFENIKNNDIEIQSLFGHKHYQDIVDYQEVTPIVFNEIKLYFPDDNIDSEVIINEKSYTILDFYKPTQLQANIVEYDFIKTKYINNFSIELKPNSEIILAIK